MKTFIRTAIGFVIGFLLLGPIGALLGGLVTWLFLQRPSAKNTSQ